MDIQNAAENSNRRGIPIDIYSQHCNRRVNSLAQMSIDNIIQKYRNEMKNERYKQINQTLARSNGEHALLHANTEFEHSVQNVYKYSKSQHFTISSSKDNHDSLNNIDYTKPIRPLNETVKPNNTPIEGNRHKNVEHCDQTGVTSREKLFADKTTYCRPVVSCNEDLAYKTMERNCRLKRLVKKLAIARQQEKQNVTWNNFINELKNKHQFSCNDIPPNSLLPLVPEQYVTPNIFDDYENDRNPCCFQDCYNGRSMPYIDRQQYVSKQHTCCNHHSLPYSMDFYCYPTSSQALHNERRKRMMFNKLIHENNQGDKKHSTKNLAGRLISNKNLFKTTGRSIRNVSVQTNPCCYENIYKNKATDNLLIDKLIQTFISDKNIEDNKISHCMINNPFENIENKIEILINCINNFINEIKLNRKLNSKAASISTKITKSKKVNMTQSDIVGKVGKARRDELVYGEILNDTSITTLSNTNFYPCTKPSEIENILKEIDKFCSKDNISPYKSQKQCSFNITFEVPTRDCSTEVTRSLSKQQSEGKAETIEEIRTSDPAPIQHMTIAVNTDPFNFLTLLRVSTEAVMRLIPNMPNINYYSYLGLLPFSQTTKNVESHYICNICGAAFNKPSALSNHIQDHNLGKTRDCCVCRHVLDLSKKPASLFKCKYCGKRFTRAYCCELHQQRCGQQLGQIPDVTSSLMLLR